MRCIQLALPSLLTLAVAQALAAPPDAGQISREPRAPLAPPSTAPALRIDQPVGGSIPEGGPTVRLQGLRFQGNSAFSQAQLQALLADAVGRELSFADLNRLAERVTRRYREAGYLVARAYLPAQELKDGQLDIAVLEGRLTRVELRNGAGLADSALAPLGQLPLDTPVQTRSLDQTLLTLADLPGTSVQTTLRPGQTVGASELLVDVSRTRRFEGSVDADNFGGTYSGEYRLGTSLYWNNPLDRGDQLSLRLQASDAQLRYERLGYQLPLGWGTRVGAAASNMSYRLGKEFAVLDAHGSSRTTSVYLRQTLLRSLDANWWGQLQFDHKRLHDLVGSTATSSRQTLDNLIAGLNGDWQDGLLGRASNALSLNLSSGHLTLDTASALLDAAGPRSAGDFNKLEASWQRVQVLRPGLNLLLNLRGQVADRNLASAEKFSLGGSQGVRAYAQGEGLGDTGWLATVELRWALNPAWQLLAFADAGGVKTDQQPWTAGNHHRRLAGPGVGASWGQGNSQVSASAAWASDRESPRPQPDRRPRLWVQGTLSF